MTQRPIRDIAPAMRPTALSALYRGFSRRCPRCGCGPLFVGWYGALEQCTECGWIYERGDGDTWAFTYISTAFISGLLVVGMFLLTPPNLIVGWSVLVASILVLMIGSMPRRRGLAIAVEYLVRCWSRADDDEQG